MGLPEHPKAEPHDDFLNRLAFKTRNMTLGPPFSLELHHAPHRKGDRGKLKIRSLTGFSYND